MSRVSTCIELIALACARLATSKNSPLTMIISIRPFPGDDDRQLILSRGGNGLVRLEGSYWVRRQPSDHNRVLLSSLSPDLLSTSPVPQQFEFEGSCEKLLADQIEHYFLSKCHLSAFDRILFSIRAVEDQSGSMVTLVGGDSNDDCAKSLSKL